MDYRIIYNIQKDLLKAVLDEKKDWYVSEGPEHIMVFQKSWAVFVVKKSFMLDYDRLTCMVKDHRRTAELMLDSYRNGMKIPLMYLSTTKLMLPNEAGKEKEVTLDVFEEDVVSGKRIYINTKLLKYLPDNYMCYNFIRIKDSDLIFILDERDNIIMMVLPIKLTPDKEVMINI